MESKIEQWDRKWGKSSILYVLFQLLRVAAVLVILITLKDIFKVIRGKKEWGDLANPRKLFFIAVVLGPLALHFYYRWKLMRLKFLLTVKANPLPGIYKKTLQRVYTNYEKWKTQPLKMVLLRSLVAPLSFAVIIFTGNAIKYRDISIDRFLSVFDPPWSFVFVFIVFYAFGIFLVRKYRNDYLLPNYEGIIQLSKNQE